MARSLDLATSRGTVAEQPRGSSLAPVGASHTFDPGADGIAGIYATRVLQRGGDPRMLCADIRADRLGSADREPRRRALKSCQRPFRFGRGTSLRLHADSAASASTPGTISPFRARRHRPSETRAELRSQPTRRPRQLAIAGLLALLLVPLGIIVASAQETPPRAWSALDGMAFAVAPK